MRHKAFFTLLILMLLQTMTFAKNWTVPSRGIPDVKTALTKSANGDTILLLPGVYTGSDNTNLIISKSVTIKSDIDPNYPDWNTIESTIINCNGSAENPVRAFTISASNVKIYGITFTKGYQYGDKGEDVPLPEDPCTPTCSDLDYRELDRAGRGGDANGVGYGGSILVDSGNPEIKYCIFSNSTITGGQGGKGGDGLPGSWWPCTQEDANNPAAVEDGQSGGMGGDGSGIGYGGAIAVKDTAGGIKLIGCTFESCFATGGVGGNGGNGGMSANDGQNGTGGYGGTGGDSKGDGRGGALYFGDNTNNEIIDCDFIGCLAKTGAIAPGGALGRGEVFVDANDNPATDGNDGNLYYTADIAGGAAYFTQGSDNKFINCSFEDNRAAAVFVFDEVEAQYEVQYIDMKGGAICAGAGSNIDVDICQFIDNSGAAIYCEGDNNINIHNDSDPNLINLFSNNSNTGFFYGSGGAMFIGPVCTSVNIKNAVFSNNLAAEDGGAIKSLSGLNMDFCSFNSNSAAGYGGAIDIYDDITNNTLNFIIQKTSFADNNSLNGGAVSFYDFSGQMTDSYFRNNFAKVGGALFIENGQSQFTGCIFRNNSIKNAYALGGAVYTYTADVDFSDCQFSQNKAEGSGSKGGAIAFSELSTRPSTVKNCLFAENSSQSQAGAINLALDAKADIQNCTFAFNSAISKGGAVFVESQCQAFIKDSIFSYNNTHAIHEYKGSKPGDAAVSYCLFYNNQQGDFYDGVTGLVYSGTAIPGGSNNLTGNPYYTAGSLGSYYLNQSASPAVNSGSDTAVNKGLNEYTTSPDDSGDAGIVDRGFHYFKNVDVKKYGLKLEFNPSQGSMEVTSPEPVSYNPSTGVYTFIEGEIVTITAAPAGGYRLSGWVNTDNDASLQKINTSTILGDKTVKALFEQVRIISVPGQYSTIQQAFDAAENGDTILLGTGVWRTPGGTNIITSNKAVNFTSLNPDDPCVVASTIIEQEDTSANNGSAGPAFRIYNVGPETVISGLTIRNFSFNALTANLPDTANGRYDGGNGFFAEGGAIELSNASPTIKNCVIENCSIFGGPGNNGADGDDTHLTGGNGGWPGGAYGGAIACLFNSSPIVENCIFRGNTVTGGNAGDGGNGGDPEGSRGGKGGGWYYGYFVNWEQEPSPYASYLDYTRYSGLGGAVYIGENASPKFYYCLFEDNRSVGGLNGICGLNYPSGLREFPSNRYRIDNFGGAVFCDNNSTPLFESCSFIDNLADTNLPADANNDDPYISLGGAVACETGSLPEFRNCHFEDNNSTSGGAIWTNGCTPLIIDCNFISNYAYTGAGLYIVDSNANILRCNIYNNDTQVPEVNDPNGLSPYEAIIGDGGGIYGNSANIHVFDCNISRNSAEKSGGGIYISNSENSIIHNSLISKNQSGRDGGGISNNWYSRLLVNNCSIVDNNTTGAISSTTYGGGLVTSYNSQTDITNSIIWGNFAFKGRQVALTTGFEFLKMPSLSSVDYSNIENGQGGVYVDIGNITTTTDDCKLTWGNHNTLGTQAVAPKFVEGYYLSQPNTGDSQQAALGLDGSVDTADPDILTDPNKSSFRPYRHTTRTDNKIDTLISGNVNNRDNVDKGYHYVLYTSMDGDFNFDGKVDSTDLMIFSEWYLSPEVIECKFPDYCNGVDLNQDGLVNLDDFSLLSRDWQIVDTTPPLPNPPAWDIAPTQFGTNSLRMSSVKAFDTMQGYNVFYYFECVSGGGPSSGWIKEREYIASGLSKGQQYGYRFRVKDTNNNQTDWSLTSYAEVAAQVPATPGNLSATTASSTRINLTWTDNSDDELGFIMQRSLDGLNFVDINTIPANVTAYADRNLNPSTSYTYRVLAQNQKGFSGYSNEAEATTYSPSWEYPVAPTRLRAVLVTDISVQITWDDRSVNEDNFVIERSVNGGPFSQLAITLADVNDYNDADVDYTTDYAYRVKATNGFGDSFWSNTLNVTTFDPTIPLKPTILYNINLPPSDSNNNSGQYLQGGYWRHKIVLQKAQLSANLYYKFKCESNDGFSSIWVPANGPAVATPINIPGWPAELPRPTILYDAAANTIIYDVVVKAGGTGGLTFQWKAGASYSSNPTSSQITWSNRVTIQ